VADIVIGTATAAAGMMFDSLSLNGDVEASAVLLMAAACALGP
jgi:hypothetical protein